MGNWYRYKPEQLELMLKTDRNTGLTPEEYKKQRRKYGENEIYPEEDLSARSYSKNIPVDFISLILLLLCLVLWFTEKDGAAIAAALIVVFSRLCAFAFYQISKKIFNARTSKTPVCRVLRGGKLLPLPQTALVPGDVILLSRGDIVPADARIVDAEDLRVLEKNISGGDGEKQADFAVYSPDLPPEEQKNMLFAGSIISRGEVCAIVCATGRDTLIRRRSARTRTVQDRIRMLEGLKKLSFAVSLVMIACVFLFSVLYIIIGEAGKLFSAFFLIASAAAAAMSELYVMFGYLIAAWALLSSVRGHRAGSAAVIQSASSFDKLHAITALAVPKESGICEPRLLAEKIYTGSREFDLTGSSVDPAPVFRTLAYALSFSDKIGALSEDGATGRGAEEDALFAPAGRLGVSPERIFGSVKPAEKRRLGTGAPGAPEALLALRDDSEFAVIVRGAPEDIIPACTSFMRSGGEYPLGATGREQLLNMARRYEQSSCRVCAVASKTSKFNHLRHDGYIMEELCFEGMIAFREPVQRGLRDTVEKCRRAGVKTLLFCDEMTEENVFLALNLGIIRSRNEVLYAHELDHSNINLLNLKMKSYRLFLGLSGGQRKYVISQLSAQGEHIGFYGQTLEDAALLAHRSSVCFAEDGMPPKAAQKSKQKSSNEASPVPVLQTAAMGRQALLRSADAVTSASGRDGTGGLRSMAETVGLVRFAYAATSKLIKYLLISGFSRMILAVLSAFTPLSALSVPQILCSGLVFDFLAVFAVLTEYRGGTFVGKSGYEEVISDPRRVLLRLSAITAAGVLSVLSCRLLLSVTDAPQSDVSAAMFFALSLFQIALLFEAMGGSARGKLKNLAFISLSAAALLFSLLAPLWGAGAGFGAFSSRILCGLITPFVFLTVTEGVRFLRKKLKQKIL